MRASNERTEVALLAMLDPLLTSGEGSDAVVCMETLRDETNDSKGHGLTVSRSSVSDSNEPAAVETLDGESGTRFGGCSGGEDGDEADVTTTDIRRRLLSGRIDSRPSSDEAKYMSGEKGRGGAGTISTV
eukprot:CAMPEP_0184662560 /NCGR_PEP_ID=MMETSP0308-20130426/43822_1 /TAXON_ID=38269 /ORGANISM="Gloeochaete witrockiana, Strain SAG 46.84" /LENGTH=129 /DNA_ID=CAMNT_0027104675 /DNA_START=774 /DNA_END=1163 /DNA_ORIENTATION=+